MNIQIGTLLLVLLPFCHCYTPIQEPSNYLSQHRSIYWVCRSYAFQWDHRIVSELNTFWLGPVSGFFDSDKSGGVLIIESRWQWRWFALIGFPWWDLPLLNSLARRTLWSLLNPRDVFGLRWRAIITEIKEYTYNHSSDSECSTRVYKSSYNSAMDWHINRKHKPRGSWENALSPEPWIKRIG